MVKHLSYIILTISSMKLLEHAIAKIDMGYLKCILKLPIIPLVMEGQ